MDSPAHVPRYGAASSYNEWIASVSWKQGTQWNLTTCNMHTTEGVIEMKATIETIGLKIADLGNAERITKALLSELSREVLEVVLVDEGKDTGKGTEDSRTINELINVLTPVNKRAAIVFFKHFSPFLVATNEAGEFAAFGKKDKKNWEAKLEEVKEFLADPHNNIWSWADRNIEVEQKPFDVKKVTKTIENSIKKAGMKATLEAVFAGGLTLENILEIMNPEEKEQE